MLIMDQNKKSYTAQTDIFQVSKFNRFEDKKIEVLRWFNKYYVDYFDE